MDGCEAVITTGTNSISVILTDLLTPAQVRSAGQALSDFQFTPSNAPGAQGVLTASGQLANVGAGGTVTNVSGTPVRWIGQGPPPPNGSGTFTVTGNTILMEAIGGGRPSQMILPPGGSFTNANASITGGQFNPFVIGPASFTLSFSGATAGTTVTAATFSFGTGPDFFIPGVPVPAPSSVRDFRAYWPRAVGLSRWSDAVAGLSSDLPLQVANDQQSVLPSTVSTLLLQAS